MSKLLKVTLEFDDCVKQIEGKEAEKWGEYADSTIDVSRIHGYYPFDSDPIRWEILTEDKNDIPEGGEMKP